MIQMHPYLASQLASERQRDMLAHAEQQRTGHGTCPLAKASRRAAAGRAARPPGPAHSRPAAHRTRD